MIGSNYYVYVTDQNTKRESGRKVQIGNVAAAKVELKARCARQTRLHMFPTQMFLECSDNNYISPMFFSHVCDAFNFV